MCVYNNETVGCGAACCQTGSLVFFGGRWFTPFSSFKFQLPLYCVLAAKLTLDLVAVSYTMMIQLDGVVRSTENIPTAVYAKLVF